MLLCLIIVDRTCQLVVAQGKQISQVLHAPLNRALGHRPHKCNEKGLKITVVQADLWMCSHVKRERPEAEGEASVVQIAMSSDLIKGDVHKNDLLQEVRMILGEVRPRLTIGNRQVLLLLTRVLLELVALSKAIGKVIKSLIFEIQGERVYVIIILPTCVNMHISLFALVVAKTETLTWGTSV